MRHISLIVLVIIVLGCTKERGDQGVASLDQGTTSTGLSADSSRPSQSDDELSKEQARKLLDIHYGSKELTGSLTLGLLDVMPPSNEMEQDPLRLFEKHGSYDEVLAAQAAGLVSVQLQEASFNDYYHRTNYRFLVELTDKGRPFDREHDSGIRAQVHWLKIADYIVSDVTGVINDGNEAKVYFKLDLRATPFFGIATPPMRRQIDTHNTPMTALAIYDGQRWHVRDVMEGVQ